MGIHGKEWNEVSRTKTEYTCLKHSAYRWRHEHISEQEDTVWMKQLEEYVGVPCDNSIPPQVNAKIHNSIVQPAML